jgi:hypothetical protein
MKNVCLLALLTFAACAPVPDDSVEIVDITDGPEVIVSTGDGAQSSEGSADLEECDADMYRPLIGTNVEEAGLQSDDRLRVYSEADIVTQEYIPQRTNVVYDTGGTIARVFCG